MSLFRTYIVHTNKRFVVVEKAVSKNDARKKIIHTLDLDEWVLWVCEKKETNKNK